MKMALNGPTGKTGHVFQNWAKTYKCVPELYFEPETVQELKQILAKARQDKKKVSIVGNGRSPSDLACTDDYMIGMTKLKKVLEINQDEKTVKVEGGILLSELNDILGKNGLALSVMGSISDVTLAGAVSTGTHGTGIDYGSLQTYVREMGLLTADGTLMTLSSTQNPDTFNAARVGLGSLGVIVWLKVQCEPAFRLHQIQYPVSFKDMIENLDVHVSSSDHFRMMWYPHTDGCIAYHVKRTSKPISRTSSWFWDYFVGYLVLEFLYWTSTFFPRIVPWINRTYYRIHSKPSEFVDTSYRVFNFNCLFVQYVMEWAIPRENTPLVLYQLKAWIENNFYAHFPVEVRFVKQDNALLSPCYGTDTCYINIVMYRPYEKDVTYEPYWSSFQEIILKAGGRPHWAKNYQLTQQQMRQLYPCWDKFVDIRRKLDPGNMFVNKNLARIFSTTE